MVLVNGHVHAQKITIGGIVSSLTDGPLENANILAFPVSNNTTTAFSISNQKGEYQLNPNYSRIFYSKAKLPAIIENARNLFSSKLGYNSFTKKPLRFPILLVF